MGGSTVSIQILIIGVESNFLTWYSVLVMIGTGTLCATGQMSSYFFPVNKSRPTRWAYSTHITQCFNVLLLVNFITYPEINSSKALVKSCDSSSVLPL